MSETLMTIIAIGTAVVLVILIPLISVSQRNDDIAISTIQSVTTEFANNAALKGKITVDDYDSLIQKIDSTGMVCDVTIEIQHLDENPGKKPAQTSGNLLGENLYYSTWDVEETLESNKYYPLKKGDNIVIQISKTQPSLGENISSAIYKVIGKNVDQTVASSTTKVINSGI